MIPIPKTNSSKTEPLASSPPKTQDIIKIQQTIISQRDQRIKDLEAEAAESKLKSASLTLENGSLRKVMEDMKTQIKVLTEALQFQLEPQVLNLERISPRLGVRASSFRSVDSNWMMGISVANKVGRSPALVEEDFPETVRAPEMPSRARKRAALVESVPPISGMAGEHKNFGGLRISISSSTDDGYAAEIEGLNAKKNRRKVKKSVLKSKTTKATSKKDGRDVEKILYDY